MQESSGFTNKKRAIDVAAIRRTELLERRAGLSQKKMAPKFEEHVEKFLAWSKQQHRPKTRDLHGTNCDTLLRFFRGCWLDEITSGMVEDFKLARTGEERSITCGTETPFLRRGSRLIPFDVTTAREAEMDFHLKELVHGWVCIFGSEQEFVEMQ